MNIKEMIELQKKIVPELFELVEKRYNILLNILYFQPIGRRTLANHLKMGERVIRTETNRLQEENLVEILRQGMVVTDLGASMIEKLQPLVREIRGVSFLEIETKKRLGLDNIIIIPGDSQLNPKISDLIGKAAAIYMKSILKDKMIIGLTGGSSVSAVAKEMPSLKLDNISVIPARGGMGRDANNQANNIAAQLASKLHGTYELLHMPDDVDEEILEVLREDPLIKETLEKLKNIDILLHGIGRADTMAGKRGLGQEKKNLIQRSNGVGEAYGHYFDKEGNVIYRSSSVGIGLNEYKKIPYVIAVAGGTDKAEAIKATCKVRRDLMLVTDESTAKAIIDSYK